MTAIVLASLSASAGADRFWRVARNMPDVAFVAVLSGDGTDQFEEWPNVEVVAEVPATTSLVLLDPLSWPDDCQLWEGVIREQAGIPAPEISDVDATAETKADAEQKETDDGGTSATQTRRRAGAAPVA